MKKIRPSPLDPEIKFDRLTTLFFPLWHEKILHPRIQDTGPNDFDIRSIQLHEIDRQRGRFWLSGKEIYAHHKRHRMLAGDFGLRELRTIQAKGVDFYNIYLKDLILVGWKSVITDKGGDIYVPFTCQRKETIGVVLDWCWIGNGHFHINGRAARFVK